MSTSTKLAQLYPGRIIVAAIVGLVLIGTALLSLSISQGKPLSLIDAFFTATSATCVTGLHTVPFTSYTYFGQAILLILIQLGGLGIITMTLFMVSLFTNFGLSTQILAGQILDLEHWHDVKKILIHVVLFTVVVETAGAVAIFLCIFKRYSIGKAIFLAIFHAVSSFCNAGISLFDTENLLPIAHNWPMLIITTLLMFFGSFGFIVLMDVYNYAKSFRKRGHFKLLLTSKVILRAHAILLSTTTIIFWLLEYNHSFAGMGPLLSLVNAFFLAVSLRSTGFMIHRLSLFCTPTLFAMLPLAFIGSAPGSTASGVKLTSLSITISTIWAAITGAKSVNTFGRRIEKDQIFKSIAIIFLSISWILLTIFALLIFDTHIPVFNVIIEAVSAFSNAGVSSGITYLLSNYSKLMLIASMIAGRIGSLTLVSALRRLSTIQKAQRIEEVTYPKERIMLS